MYAYEWDSSTGGYILTPMPLAFSKEPRPVYYKELDILGFDKYWDYDKNDSFPYMWAEANKEPSASGAVGMLRNRRKDVGQISPMMTHYLETKKQYPD